MTSGWLPLVGAGRQKTAVPMESVDEYCSVPIRVMEVPFHVAVIDVGRELFAYDT